MNGKQAKRLRRAALGLAVTMTEAGREIKKDGYQIKVHDNKLNAQRVIADQLEAGVPENVRFEVPPSQQLLVRKDSMKGIYKTLKSGKV